MFSFYLNSRRTVRGRIERKEDGFHQDGLAMGRRYHYELTAESIESSSSTVQYLSAAHLCSRFHPQRFGGSFSRYILGNYHRFSYLIITIDQASLNSYFSLNRRIYKNL